MTAITGNAKIAGVACGNAGNPTNLADIAGGTTKDTKDTNNTANRLASSRSAVPARHEICETAGRHASANL